LDTTEFNEFGTPIGTKPIAILDSDGVVLNIITINENETEENIQQFVSSFSGVSYQDVTVPKVILGSIWNGEEFTNLQVDVVPEIPTEFPENP
jgi:hypothetical protein